MSSDRSYGQFCPLAMAAEFLCNRWTLLILRELLLGSHSFNDISKGVARMSRTLLSERLKELTKRGIVSKQVSEKTPHAEYRLTQAGQALSSVVFSMADWSQEWLQIEPSLENISADHLMWSLRRSARHHSSLPNPFIVHIYLSDQTKEKQNAWLVFKNEQVDLCIVDHQFNVDVQIEASTRNLTCVYMGWTDFKEAIKNKEVIFRGPSQYTKVAQQWLGRSRLANIKKQPKELQVS
ncbi:helix-turn-helix domain-containing protein [uncultured Paraglaciecola sp.]|uniref:winged helix-turn-helix transcriptional regulator n=1 Tax=uncultured Paraglaciecola sp. TaxID=1765024 RepID=UPI00260BB70E|nr:helix-turn-helix domain-containing protein [uncultured Paraglaciecola sp.]